MSYQLIVRRQGQAIDRIPLEGDHITIGRDPDCDVCLTSEFVSRLHARLERLAEGFEVVDAGSRNGVFLNRKRLESRADLASGDELSIADFLLTYWRNDPGGQTKPFAGDFVADLRVERASREIWIREERLSVNLSRQEFDLLALLAEHRGEVCPRDLIGDSIWGTATVNDTRLPQYDFNLIHRLVSRLKQKLGPGFPFAIETVTGIGYKLE